MESITLEEINSLKNTMEQKIGAAISEFSNKTGIWDVQITGIEPNGGRTARGEKCSHVTSVFTKVTI